MPIVSFQDKKIDVIEGEILFDALEKKGVVLPHGCLAGSCSACRVEIIKNPENLDPPGLIESDTLTSLKDDYTKRLGSDSIKNKNIRLACRAKIKGDLSIEIFK